MAVSSDIFTYLRTGDARTGEALVAVIHGVPVTEIRCPRSTLHFVFTVRGRLIVLGVRGHLADA